MIGTYFLVQAVLRNHIPDSKKLSVRSPKPSNTGVAIYEIALGLIGKSGEALAHEPTFNDNLASYIPAIYGLLENGKLRPNEIKVVEKGGFEGIADAYAIQQKAQGGGKVVITLQEE